MNEFTPGMFPDMPNDQYQAAPAISKSRLDEAARSPRHYWGKYLDPDREPEKKTEALIMGDATHDSILSPLLFERRFVTTPKDAPRRPSTTQVNAEKPSARTVEAIHFWNEFERENAGRILLKDDDWDYVHRIRDAVHNHPEASQLLSGGAPEVSFFAVDPETGAGIKARTDYLRVNDSMIVDLKTTTDASPDGFGRSAEKYRYHVQGWWYPHVLEAHYDGPAIEHFVFVAVEKEPPFAIGIYWMTERDYAEGEAAARENLKTILECQASGFWPDFGAQPTALQRPNFRRRTSLKQAA